MLTWLCSGAVVFVLSMLTALTSKCQLSRLELLLLSFFFNQELVSLLTKADCVNMVMFWMCNIIG